jgi:hypothetical protein
VLDDNRIGDLEIEGLMEPRCIKWHTCQSEGTNQPRRHEMVLELSDGTELYIDLKMLPEFFTDNCTDTFYSLSMPNVSIEDSGHCIWLERDGKKKCLRVDACIEVGDKDSPLYDPEEGVRYVKAFPGWVYQGDAVATEWTKTVGKNTCVCFKKEEHRDRVYWDFRMYRDGVLDEVALPKSGGWDTLKDVMGVADWQLKYPDGYRPPWWFRPAQLAVLLFLVSTCLWQPFWWFMCYLVYCYGLMGYMLLSGQLSTVGTRNEQIVKGIITWLFAPIYVPLMIAFFAIRLPVL